MFRFTIRELVLLTLVVAMGIGWWVDSARKTSAYQELQYTAGDMQFRANALQNLAEDCGYTLRFKPFNVQGKRTDPDAEWPGAFGTSSAIPIRYE
jgi:hypothetical protein